MKHVIEMIQNARRLAGPDHPEFLTELEDAEYRLRNFDEVDRDRINNLTSSERFRRRSNEMEEANRILRDALVNAQESRDRFEACAKHLREENAALKAENEKLATMVDQRGDAEAQNDWLQSAVLNAQEELRKRLVFAVREMMPREKQIRPMPVGAAAEKTPDDTIEIVQAAKYVGQEWCLIEKPPVGYVCFETYKGIRIILCEVRKCVETGVLTRTPIPITELPQV